LTLALSTIDTWLLGAVILLTVLAIGHLAVRWEQHTSKPARPKHPGTSKGPKQTRPPRPPRTPEPATSTILVEPKAGTAWDDRTEVTLDRRREWVRERVVHWWVVANRAHGTSLDEVPTVTFSPRLKHALGWANSSRNLLKFSDHHLMDKSQKVADETVAHEVAHIFADKHYRQPCRHGKLWKKTMVAMGQKPDVTFKDTPEDGPEEDELAGSQGLATPPTAA